MAIRNNIFSKLLMFYENRRLFVFLSRFGKNSAMKVAEYMYLSAAEKFRPMISHPQKGLCYCARRFVLVVMAAESIKEKR